MTTGSLIPLLAAIAYVPLFAILISNRPWQKQHRLFASYIAAAMVWGISTFLIRSDFFIDKLLLFKLVICSFIWATVQFYYFVRFYFAKSGGFGMKLGYASLGVLIIAAALGYVPQTLAVEANNVVRPVFGWWFFLIAIPPIVLTGELVWSLVRRLRIAADPAEFNRITYLLTATGFATVFAVAGLTAFGERFPIAQLGHLANAMILTYATLKHQLLDMRVFMRRWLSWAGLVAVAAGTCVLLFFLIALVAGVEIEPATFGLSVLGIAVIGAMVYLLRDSFVRWVDRFFYKERYDYRQRLFDFTRHELSGIVSLRELGEGLLPLLGRSLDSQRALLLLPEVGSGDFVTEFSEPRIGKDSPLSIRQDSPIVEWLKREDRYLSKGQLDILPEFRGLWMEEREKLRTSGVELLFPLVSRGSFIGVLAVGRKKSGRYSLDDLDLVQTVLGQVATGLEKEYLQEQLRKREQELSVINRLAGVMTSSLNIHEVYDAFILGLRDVVDVNFATIALIERDELCFQAVHAETGSTWETGGRIPLKGTATEWVARHKKALVEPDLTKKRRFWTGEEYIKQEIRSVVYLPMLVKSEVIGSLIIASRRPDAYSPEQVHLLERLAVQVAMPVENGRLYAKAEQRARVDELTGLFNRRHFDESLKQEIDRHSRYSGALSLILLDLDYFKNYNDREGHLAGDKMLAHVSLLIERSVRNADQAFRYGGDEFAILVPQSSADDAFVVAERVRGTIASDMGSKKTVITASLGLASWPNDGVALDELVNAADRALYHAKRTGGNRTCVVSKMLPSLTETAPPGAAGEKEALSTIYALAATIEARDPYTYGHSRKVSYYAVTIAEALGLPSEKVAIVSTAALLHDIGKIGIADEVLNKTGKLSDQEWELIKSHPRLSATIVGHVPSLTPCLPAILHHQERWDGTGYPSGLKGEAIPLEARILAVADAFDAMTSPRPYRGPLSYKEALEEMKRCSGSQFDPKLVEVFLPIALATVPEELAIGESADGRNVG